MLTNTNDVIELDECENTTACTMQWVALSHSSIQSVSAEMYQYEREYERDR